MSAVKYRLEMFEQIVNFVLNDIIIYPKLLWTILE